MDKLDERDTIDGAARFLAREIHSDIMASEAEIAAGIAETIRRFCSPGVEAIGNERMRQRRIEGWSEAHDDDHAEGELAIAAARYALHSALLGSKQHADIELLDQMSAAWPWEKAWWKPKRDRVRMLEKAGALIAAEIERRLRSSAK